MRRSPISPSAWRFLNTGDAPASFNMALDEAISDSVRDASSPPTIRVYGWNPSAVSLGYAQKLNEEVDPEICGRYGIQIVRRQTGGRTVLHADELTYCVIAPEDHPAIGKSPYENYRRVSEALLGALKRIGVPGELSAGPDLTPEGFQGACFSYAARFEVVVQHKKIVGSAQRRARGVVLQHGTLLLGPGHKKLSLLLPSTHRKKSEILMRELNEKTISVSEVLNRRVPLDELIPIVRSGFETTLGISTDDLPLSHEELTAANILVAEKYGTREWTTRSKSNHALR